MFDKFLKTIFQSRQSQVILAVGLVMMLLNVKKLDTVKVIAALIAILINAYIINCLLHGDCGIYAWIVVFFHSYALYNVLSVKNIM